MGNFQAQKHWLNMCMVWLQRVSMSCFGSGSVSKFAATAYYVLTAVGSAWLLTPTNATCLDDTKVKVLRYCLGIAHQPRS